LNFPLKILKVIKTREGGLAFSSFKLSLESDRVQSLEQCLESYAADMKEIKREKKETQTIILLFLPQSGSSSVLLALPMRFSL